MPTLSSYKTDVEPVDVAVIGAGINGLAVAREAARRGLSVVVIDQDDVGARTSAISTRLIHGGLKYLERLELNLVYESIRERNILLKCAPHLVHHYPMLIPFGGGQSRPGWLLACGLLLHDVLSTGKKLPRNRIVFGKRMRKEWPEVAEGGVGWGGLFHDAHVPLTERLTIELAIDAHNHGATLLTHSRVESFIKEGDRVAGVVYRDRIDGALKPVRAQVVVNAAGPWVDDVLALSGTHSRKMGPTKGSHLVVDPFDGAPSTCIFFESPQDKRPMFVLPWNGRYMIGTTDIPYIGSLDEIVIDAEETLYLLNAVNKLIPRAKLVPEDVLWSYSGVRPLPFTGDLDDPSKISRDHEIVVHKGTSAGLVTLIGGKWTTHRALGEQVTRKIAGLLGRKLAPSTTRFAALPGAPDTDWSDFRQSFIEACPLPLNIASRLVDVYGVAAANIAQLASENPELAEIVDEETQAIAAEAVYAVRDEGAFTLEDVLLRRMVVALNSDVGLAAAPAVAKVLVAHAGWTQPRAERELAQYRQSMRRFTPRALEAERSAND
jgi:glycerol-3-phosphate dehydrogenase